MLHVTTIYIIFIKYISNNIFNKTDFYFFYYFYYFVCFGILGMKNERKGVSENKLKLQNRVSLYVGGLP